MKKINLRKKITNFFDKLFCFFDKFIDFYIDYEELINVFIISLGVIFLSCSIYFHFAKEFTTEKHIIENTKNYVIYENCKKFNDKYYCWEEN